MWPNLFKRTPKLDLDPERAQQTMALFDEKQGYQSYAKRCQTAFSGTTNSAPSLLKQQGVEHLQVLSEQDASSFLAQALSLAEETISKQEIDYSEILLIRDKVFLDTWFHKIFTPALTSTLTNYFESEFSIYWYTFLRAKPAVGATRSFLWHCDKGPSAHLKILLYLNDVQEHQGNTIFLNRATTTRFAQSGYVFGSVKKRMDDLSELARQEGISLQPQSWDLKAGEGIAFEPSQVLHKGILPSTGYRYVLAFCLLPSPLPWDMAFRNNHHEGFSSSYTWHSNAQEIWSLIQQAPNT
ncbi:MAG TPA: hypothetical protein PKK23_03830 [Nitrospirales bacterium]|nr:hypothetical protein [Nitrospirales bacterium]